VRVADGCFVPGSVLPVSFESAPVALGTVRVDANGRFAADLRIPLGAEPGRHHFVVTGESPGGAAHRSSGPVTVADLDCPDLSQAEAQALLRANPADPHGLDDDRDGLPCEASPAGPLPRTGTSTQDLLLLACLLLGLGLLLEGRRQRRYGLPG
jgi:LPXTG-motif cell wall-anchored protein